MEYGVSVPFEDILKLRGISPAFSSEKIYEHLQANSIPEGFVPGSGQKLYDYADKHTELFRQRKKKREFAHL